MSKDEFIDYIADTVQPRPGNYKTIITINKKMLTQDEIEMADLEGGSEFLCDILLVRLRYSIKYIN